MTLFDENTNYNFAYSNCWSNRITDTFEIEEFEKDFKTLAQYLKRFETAQPEGEQK